MKNDIKNIFAIGDIEDTLTKNILSDLWNDKNLPFTKTVNIQIQTIGGDLHCCFALYDSLDYLRNTYNFKINTWGLGKVASAGFFLFLLGDERLLFPSTRVFVHEHLVINDEESPYSSKVKEFKEDKALYNIYCRYVMRRLNLTKRSAGALLKKNKWLTKQEIINYNIATTIYE